MNLRTLPTSLIIGETEIDIYTDYRDILDIFSIFNNPNLLDTEKVIVGLERFYKTSEYKPHIEDATKQMFAFMSMNDEQHTIKSNSKPLYDWDQDFNIIVAPINRVMNTDVRGLDYLHWWTFLSAFMEIGECTFNTYVGIRDKLNRGKKLEKYEEKILKEHREDIILKSKVDDVTQDIMNDILGV